MSSSPTVHDWHTHEFLPWLAKAQSYQAEKAEQQAALRRHLPALQTMVGLLLEGQTKRAVLAWNSLNLEPILAEIVVSKDGEQVLLRAKGGRTEILALDELIAGLKALSQPVAAETIPPLGQASGS